MFSEIFNIQYWFTMCYMTFICFILPWLLLEFFYHFKITEFYRLFKSPTKYIPFVNIFFGLYDISYIIIAYIIKLYYYLKYKERSITKEEIKQIDPYDEEYWDIEWLTKYNKNSFIKMGKI